MTQDGCAFCLLLVRSGTAAADRQPDGQGGHLAASTGERDESLQQAALLMGGTGDRGGTEGRSPSLPEGRGLVQVFIGDDDPHEGDADKEKHTGIEKTSLRKW